MRAVKLILGEQGVVIAREEIETDYRFIFKREWNDSYEYTLIIPPEKEEKAKRLFKEYLLGAIGPCEFIYHLFKEDYTFLHINLLKYEIVISPIPEDVMNIKVDGKNILNF